MMLNHLRRLSNQFHLTFVWLILIGGLMIQVLLSARRPVYWCQMDCTIMEIYLHKRITRLCRYIFTRLAFDVTYRHVVSDMILESNIHTLRCLSVVSVLYPHLVVKHVFNVWYLLADSGRICLNCPCVCPIPTRFVGQSKVGIDLWDNLYIYNYIYIILNIYIYT